MSVRLVEKALVKDFANIARTDLFYDTRIFAMIEQASAEVEDMTRRTFTFGTYTEYYQSYDQVYTDPTPQYVWLNAFPLLTEDPSPSTVAESIPQGAVDGANTVFVFSNGIPNPATSLITTVNGQLQTMGVDYFFNPGAQFIVFQNPPPFGSAIRQSYVVGDPTITLPIITWAPNEFWDTIGVVLQPTDFHMMSDRGLLVIRRASGLISGALLPLYLGNLIFSYAPLGFRVTYSGGYPVSKAPDNQILDPLDEYGVVQVPKGLKYIIAKKIAKDLTDGRIILSPWTLEEQKTLHAYRKRDIPV